jgi:glycosyltransferase involved in cell wall biosynthesis
MVVYSPSVSLAIPVYNEADCIEKVVRSFLQTCYLNLIEVIIADGGSTDGTQNIIQRLSTEDSRVRLLHNSQKIQSAGLNLILEHCTGDIFLRADAHSDYAFDYIERCVEALLTSKAHNVGGAQRFVAKTPFQAGAALAARSLLGNGGAKYRNPDYSGYADTVYLGCFWKNDLIALDAYHNHNITNEDAELNQQLKKIHKNAIYIDSKIRVWYYPRSTCKSLFLQYFKYGRGRYLTSVKHSQDIQLRGKLPFLIFFVIFILSCIAIFVESFRLPVEEIISFGLIISIGESLRTTWKFNRSFREEIWRGRKKDIPSFASRWILCTIVLQTMPLAHFSGYAYQLFRHKILRLTGW